MYKICKCKHCGRHSCTTAKTNFVCAYCRVSEKFGKKGIYKVNIIKLTDNGREASLFCSELNDKRDKK